MSLFLHEDASKGFYRGETYMVCQQNAAFSKCLDNAVQNLHAVFLLPSFVPCVNANSETKAK